ncbi:MAG TPA: indole-3-glycerol phosphate synthase TrpC [Longimicrobiales bacterium]|nr:indole-3-glycerol phosphate synthase TrpC [Longimicrobiales bacterium]
MAEPQGSRALPGILASIERTKREELGALRPRGRELERAALAAAAPRDLEAALRSGEHVAVIAECKRRSPGAGEIRPGLDPGALARAYEAAGAKAVSVLTDQRYFGGSLDDLVAARAATAVPVLRKDFTLDPLHVLEARAAGADAVLLIVRILGDDVLRSLQALARELGMAALVEAHDAAEVDRALGAGATLLGINNRDLATFTTDLDTTLRLLEAVPRSVAVVSESGIRTPDDVVRLGGAGVEAILVGETLLRAPDPGAAAAGLARVARGRRARG